MLIWRTAAWPGVRRPGLPRPERGADAGPAAPLRRLLPTTLGYAQGLLPPSAWNGSWDDARIIPAQLVPSVRLPVLSVQLHRLQVRGDKHRDIDLGLVASARSFYYVVRGGQRVRKDTKTHQDRWRDDAYLSSNDPAHSRTIRKWIRHRAETRIAAADAYRIRR